MDTEVSELTARIIAWNEAGCPDQEGIQTLEELEDFLNEVYNDETL